MQKLDSNFFILTARPAAEREKAVANIRQFLGMPDIPVEFVCSRFNSKPDDSGTNYNSPASETYEAARFSFTVDPKTNYIVETGEADADRERKWMAHAGLKTCHYPEKGVRLATDILIPKPYEVHHHIAYFELDQAMGWGVAIPAVPFSLEEGDRGALSPFYDNAEVKPHYFFESLKSNDVWLKIAVLDYLAGLIDRTFNDVLFLPNGDIKVTDNGLSFVEGADFVTQVSVIREALCGQELPKSILDDVACLNATQIQNLSRLIHNPEQALKSVMLRREVLLNKQRVV